MGRKTTSLKIEEMFWKKVKIHCIENNMDISDYIEDLIKKDLIAKDTIESFKSDSKKCIEC